MKSMYEAPRFDMVRLSTVCTQSSDKRISVVVVRNEKPDLWDSED